MASLALVFDLLARDEASPAFRKVGDEAERAGKQTSAFGSLTTKAMATAAGALAGIGIVSVLGGAVTAASDLNETVNKTNVIFGQNAREVREWARGSAQSFGLSQQAALEAASGFGNMLTQLGYTADAALEASTGTVKLAADLGSFNNLDTGDVLDRIGAALRGEYDSLQLLIPNINAARVQTEALAATGKTNADQLTAQEKAAATLAIVQRDGASAANDFAETSDGLANSQKILTAEWEDAQAALGQLLVGPVTGLVQVLSEDVLPLLTGTVGVVSDVIDVFGDLPGPIKATIGVVAGLVVLKGPLSSLFTTLGSVAESSALKLLYAKDAIAGLGSVGGAARAGLGGLVSFLGGPWGVAIAATVGSFALLSSVTKDNEQATTDATDAQRSFADALRESNGVIDESVRRSAAKSLQDAGLLDIAEQAGISLSDMTDAILGNADAYDTVSEALETYKNQRLIASGYEGEGSNKLHEQADAAQGAIENFETLAGTLDETAAEQSQLAEATGEAATATTEASEEAQKALEDWRHKLQNIAASFVDPAGIYQDLVQEMAQTTADSTSDASDSWSDYVDDVDVSLDELAARLQEQLDNQANWRDNLAQIARWAGADVANYLAQMGEDGVDLVAQMADGTTAGAQDMREQILREIQMGGAEWTASLDNTTKVMAAIGTAGGKATVQGLASQLQVGADEVRRIAQQYGIDLAEGVNPLLLALGKPVINAAASRPGGYQASYNADGNLYEKHDAQIAPAGAMRVWAEPETGGEAYIPLSPAKRSRSVGIWQETGRRLGMFANGGFFTGADIPAPYSTAPYGPPLSTAGDAAMDAEYQAAKSFVTESGPFGRALAWARTQIGKPYIWGGVGPTGYDCSGFQSAITNVLLGLSPYSRRGSTATFPWPGFAAGDGVYTIGSTPNAGGGIGHMAGTLLGVNVESRGGQGVVVGGSARGAHDGLFGTRAHLATFHGGTPYVPRTGNYLLQEGERVIPREMNRLPVGAGAQRSAPPVRVVFPSGMTIQGRVTFDKNGLATIAGEVVDHRLGQLSDELEYSGGV
jgi:hypothetical protein